MRLRPSLSAVVRSSLFAACGVLSACSGGGGDAPPPSQIQPPRVLLADTDVPANQTTGTLEIALAADDDLPPPTMLQLELVVDPARITWTGDVAEVVEVGTVDAGVLAPGRLRIVFGDTTTKSNPPRLPTGAVLRVGFAVPAGAARGAVTVTTEHVVGSGPAGAAVEMNGAAPVAKITLR